MKKWKARQTNLFEKSPEIAAMPEPRRQKALLLVGLLLTEALAVQSGDESIEQSREGVHDKDQC